jgi:hypothetical protein
MSSECPTCGEDFETEMGMKVHHSSVHDESIATTVIVCEFCNEEFEVADSEVSNRTYCSRKCNQKSQIDRNSKDCEFCGEKFEFIPSRSPVCCSKECSNRYLSEEYSGKNSHRWKEKTKRDCHTCGKTMTLVDWELDDRVVCSRECYKVYLSEQYSGEDSWHWKENTEDNYGYEWIEIAERIRDENDRRCQVCGNENEDRKIPVHHIVPVSDFSDVSEAHFKENLVPLCDSCHQFVEYRWSTEEQIEAFNKDRDKFDV